MAEVVQKGKWNMVSGLKFAFSIFLVAEDAVA